MAKIAKLLFENGPDWRYATGTTIADPALWYRTPSGQSHIIVSDLEIALMKQTARVNHIHSFGDVKKHLGDQPLNLLTMVKFLMEQDLPDAIEVPAHFGARPFEKLRAADLPMQVCQDDLFFPARAVKTPDEISKLRDAQRLNEKCFRRAIHILKQSKIESDATLSWHSKPLTSEIMQREMRMVALKGGAVEYADGPIVACGAHGAMPHERGHGVLRAHEFIVIDSFPRHPNGTWGDLTRTYIKGEPTDWQRSVYAAVLGAQELALSMLKRYVDGQTVHAAVVKYFTDAGFQTGMSADGTPYGFFHGTGHGVGLELHDPGPRMLSTVACPLLYGYVTSVEPGLYYPPGTHPGGSGGCRIEDVVSILKTGHRNLTKLPKDDWIIE